VPGVSFFGSHFVSIFVGVRPRASLALYQSKKDVIIIIGDRRRLGGYESRLEAGRLDKYRCGLEKRRIHPELGSSHHRTVLETALSATDGTNRKMLSSDDRRNAARVRRHPERSSESNVELRFSVRKENKPVFLSSGSIFRTAKENMYLS